jgi:hypothetical protein
VKVRGDTRPSIVAAVRTGQRDAGGPLEIFLWSRLAIWLTALAAYLLFEPNRNPLADRWDAPQLHDLGWALDVWARWDSVWFIRIAEHGYSEQSFTPAFAPLYPAVVAGIGRVLGGHYVLAGTIVSLVACAAAFVLLERLGSRLLDGVTARRAVLYLAVFPTAVFLTAVYSESLYLALSIAGFLLAERGRFVAAGAAAGLAALTRVAGLALIPALAMLAWRRRDRGSSLAGLALAPALWLVYPLVLWLEAGDPLAFRDAQREGWQRELSPYGPLAGLWDGLQAGWDGLRRLGDPAAVGRFAEVTATTPLRAAGLDVEQLAFLLVFLVLTVVAWRRLGAPYGLFAALSLAIPLSSPADDYPLLSMPRFGLVIFPLFLALATLGERPRVHVAIVATSAMLLGLATAQWALWQWVA